MQIEVGKFYKRRDGQIVGPVEGSAFPQSIYPFSAGGEDYDTHGKWMHKSENKNQEDLIEEATDPAITAAAEPSAETWAPPAIKTNAPGLGQAQEETPPHPMLESMVAYRKSGENVFRPKYRELTDFDKRVLEELKSRAYWLLCHIEAHIPDGRYQAMAKTALEESIMWAVKEVTK